VDIGTLSKEESSAFFSRAFDSVFIKYDEKAIDTMALWSSGFPKIMHLIGDTVAELKAALSPKEEIKLDNFLTRMKKLHAITPTGIKGEYKITNNMLLMYIVMEFS
jgi:hypothetical protein